MVDHSGQFTSGAGNAAMQAELQALFQSLTRQVELVLFSDAGRHREFTELTRQVIRMIRQLTDKVSLREYPLDHPLARQYGVTTAPALLFSPEQYHITWYGAPAGEEGRTFIETLLLVGGRAADLNESAAGILSNLAEPRELKVFVSPTCPYCPQQAVNAVKAAVKRPDLIRVELIDIQLNPELAEAYKAHSVPQVWANEVQIAMGAQPEELFMASVAKLSQQNIFIPDNDASELEVDLVIVGGGPAGLTAGIYGTRSGLSSVIVEKGALGGQIATTPVVENYPGLTHVGGKALVDIMVSHALEYAKIFPDEEVLTITPGEPIMVQTSRRKFFCRAVLLATGAQHRRLQVPGEERFFGHGVSYCSTCDGPLFSGKKVIMVGGGNSAVTEALHLVNIGVDVTLVHRRTELRAQKVLQQRLAEAAVPLLLATEVTGIFGDHRLRAVGLVDNETGRTWELEVDGVFVAIGYQPATKLARLVGAEISDDGYIQRDQRHRTSVPGIYSAGDVAGGFKQIVTAAGEGAAAALAIFEDLLAP